MAFADPQTVVVGAASTALPRVSVGENRGVFRKDDFSLTINHAYNKRTRRVVRLDTEKLTGDLLMPAVNVPVNMSVQLVIDAPKFGFPADSQVELAEALVAFVGSDDFLAHFVGGES